MITEATTTVAGLLAAAAAAAIATLPLSEVLTAAEVRAEAGDLDLDGSAVLVEFAGEYTGELVLLVDGELTAALNESPFGALDLAAALTPTVQAIGNAIGSIALGPLQELDLRLALRRGLGHADSALLPLQGVDVVRAAIVLGLDQRKVPVRAVPSADRLDLLRGVEMAATAELGRTRMTVNDLLSLRTGAVIELDRAAGAPADLFVNGRLIARGEVVVVDENYGLRITQVVSDDTGR